MTNTKSFDSGMLAGILFAVAAQAGNWLITPGTHPDAGTLRKALVVAQALVCVGAALYIIGTRRSRIAAPAV